MMDQVLVYADSLSWGIIPNTRNRLPFDKRWPGVLEAALNKNGRNIRVIENCLNGRRTLWDDPVKEGRNGAQGLAQVIEMHSPLKLVVLMLGTNDFQRFHENDALSSAEGVARLIQLIRQAPIEPGMPMPNIMVVAPPKIAEPKGVMADKFEGAPTRCLGFSQELEKIAKKHAAFYFDANTVTFASRVDGVHLDENQHKILGESLALNIITIGEDGR